MYDDEGKLVYLYRVIDGLCTRSHAFSAALTVGLPDKVIQRAYQVSFVDIKISYRLMRSSHSFSCWKTSKPIK